MAFSTFPNNPFPPSTAQFNEGKNDAIQAEIDAIKDGSTIDSFGGVETALATKTNLSNIAPTFDATSGVYAIGDKVIYGGVLYEFTSAHATAGEWDENETQPVKVSELIDTLKSGLISSIVLSFYGNHDIAPFEENASGVVFEINDKGTVLGYLVIRPKNYSSPSNYPNAIELYNASWEGIWSITRHE